MSVNIVKAVPEDFEYIYKLSAKNSKLLGYVRPPEIREAIKLENALIVMVDNKKAGFCIFRRLKTKSQVTVQYICIDSNYRGNKLASTIIKYLSDLYGVSIKATCVKDSDSEKFWSAVGDKIEELPGKNRPICRYIVKGKNHKNKLF